MNGIGKSGLEMAQTTWETELETWSKGVKLRKNTKEM